MKRHQLNLRKRVENKCRIGERGQIPKNVTGLENEVGTPRQLRFLPNNFRGSHSPIRQIDLTQGHRLVGDQCSYSTGQFGTCSS